MLRKTPTTTYIPGTPGVAGRAASLTCQPATPVGPDSNAPTPPTTGGIGNVVVPQAGTRIVLEMPLPGGGYQAVASVAPAPLGYVCTYQVYYDVTAGSGVMNPIAIVCRQP